MVVDEKAKVVTVMTYQVAQQKNGVGRRVGKVTLDGGAQTATAEEGADEAIRRMLTNLDFELSLVADTKASIEEVVAGLEEAAGEVPFSHHRIGLSLRWQAGRWNSEGRTRVP